jgi:hypothetical protein
MLYRDRSEAGRILAGVRDMLDRGAEEHAAMRQPV